jgi:hypothetical protein
MKLKLPLPSVVLKEVIDKVFSSDDGWTTVYEGPTLRIPDFEVKKEATGADSIREGIDAEILQMMNKSLVEEEAAIVDDLKRQMEAKIPQLLDQATHCPKCGSDIHISSTLVSCTKCIWFYVPLQVSNIFKKEEDK